MLKNRMIKQYNLGDLTREQAIKQGDLSNWDEYMLRLKARQEQEALVQRIVGIDGVEVVTLV